MQAPSTSPHPADRIVMKLNLPSIDGLKSQAKHLRADLAASGTEIGHSRALEMIAHQYGYGDWNTLFAAVGNRPTCPVWIGQTVTGHFMGQAFIGTMIGVTVLPGNRYHVKIDFDEAVDVVTFDSFSNFRKRVNCIINPDGRTDAKTSNGQPHLVLDF